ncbi:MAG TPA: rRNA maturation RNase YbeY [Beijerinckiaceae bacterium]|nr:rRNA maturation RNase YbeY [Beijerinckiaceae bacterium]
MTVAVIEIIVADDRWLEVPGVESTAEVSVRAAFAASGLALLPSAEASVLLTDDDAVAELNRKWRGKPTATNVLSFPAAAPEALARSPVIGDIALAYQTCRREAEEQGKPLADHLAHLVVHGALHLVGYDHEGEAEAERMEALEVRVLAGLGIADPYVGTEAAS